MLLLFQEKLGSMKQANWNLLDRQTLSIIKLKLTCNLVYNIVKENTTMGLIKAMSDMYKKPSTIKKKSIYCASV